MIVDNSIIVIDNVMQRWRQGMPLADALVKGTNEVFTPMLSSVLTTCSVFVPLIFLSGIAGALFYDQAMGVTISLVRFAFRGGVGHSGVFHGVVPEKKNMSGRRGARP